MVEIHKYVGRIVIMIYQNKDGNISKRAVRIHSVRDGMVRAFCYSAGAFRTFRTANILAVLPTMRRAG